MYLFACRFLKLGLIVLTVLQTYFLQCSCQVLGSIASSGPFEFSCSCFSEFEYVLGSLLSKSSSLVCVIFPFEFKKFPVFTILFKIRISKRYIKSLAKHQICFRI